jgi:hypothetical protein
MHLVAQFSFAVIALMSTPLGRAAGTPFTGSWSIDLRTPAERDRKAECGFATVTLTQSADKITGDHSMATPDCGRVNDGGEGTVKGVVVGTVAVVVVTSARNGGVALGTAKLERGALRWRMLEEIKPGEPQGDSPLILWDGLLDRQPNRVPVAK